MFKKQFTVYRFFMVLALSIPGIPVTLCGNSISLELRQAPSAVQRKIKREITQAPTKKGAPSKNNFVKKLPKLQGFTAIYGGYVDYSNEEGQIQFPLLHKDPKLQIIITPHINLTTVHGNTISHKNLDPKAPKKIYLIEKKEQGTLKNKTFYYKVSEVPEKQWPINNLISPISIVILTKPKNLVVPKGDFMTSKSPNLVLPPIYVVGNETDPASTSKFFDQRRFFEQIKKTKSFEKTTRKEIITNN